MFPKGIIAARTKDTVALSAIPPTWTTRLDARMEGSSISAAMVDDCLVTRSTTGIFEFDGRSPLTESVGLWGRESGFDFKKRTKNENHPPSVHYELQVPYCNNFGPIISRQTIS